MNTIWKQIPCLVFLSCQLLWPPVLSDCDKYRRTTGFYKYCDNDLLKSTAAEECARYGMKLLTLDTYDEYLALGVFVASLEADVWVGASASGIAQEYVWDGTNDVVPRDYFGRQEQYPDECVSYRYRHSSDSDVELTSRLRTSSCQATKAYVCEENIVTPVYQTTDSSAPIDTADVTTPTTFLPDPDINKNSALSTSGSRSNSIGSGTTTVFRNTVVTDINNKGAGITPFLSATSINGASPAPVASGTTNNGAGFTQVPVRTRSDAIGNTPVPSGTTNNGAGFTQVPVRTRSDAIGNTPVPSGTTNNGAGITNNILPLTFSATTKVNQLNYGTLSKTSTSNRRVTTPRTSTTTINRNQPSADSTSSTLHNSNSGATKPTHFYITTNSNEANIGNFDTTTLASLGAATDTVSDSSGSTNVSTVHDHISKQQNSNSISHIPGNNMDRKTPSAAFPPITTNSNQQNSGSTTDYSNINTISTRISPTSTTFSAVTGYASDQTNTSPPFESLNKSFNFSQTFPSTVDQLRSFARSLQNMSKKCPCGCSSRVKTEVSGLKFAEANVRTMQREIHSELSVDTKGLSSTIRKKTSAKDERKSAGNLGFIGISILALICAALLLADFSRIFIPRKYLRVRQKSGPTFKSRH